MTDILIWDAEGQPPEGNFLHLLWCGFVTTKSPRSVSIPELIEENADLLRTRYLAWLYDLGQTQVFGRRLIDQLSIRTGFSYWWMTLIAEKYNYAKSPMITECIRLLAFDHFIENQTFVKSVTLVSNNPTLRSCLEKWCELKSIGFAWQSIPNVPQSNPLRRRLSGVLPQTAKAGIWLLKYVSDRWCFRGVGVEEWRKAKSQITFVSYFFNLRPEAAQNGCFESEYWTLLPNTLDKEKICSSWMHLYIKNPVLPTAKSAVKLLRAFNLKYQGQQVHVALDSFLSIKVVFGTVRDYLKVIRIGSMVYPMISQSDNKKHQLMESLLWPLFKSDWDQSFFGSEAMKNLLMLNLFEKAFSSIERQCLGIYLQENMAWEFGMINAWRASNHQRLVGFPHATVRFWDLRYFFDSRSYHELAPSLPRPDFIAVSGLATQKAYFEAGYPLKELVEVEALRYLYLERRKYNGYGLRSTVEKKLRLLVLGDYLSSNTLLQLNFLRQIASELDNIDLTVKPHPGCPIDVDDYPELKFRLSEQPLSELFCSFNIVFTSNATSSAVDAYSAGLRVISVLDPNSLNFSPLREVLGVRLVSTAAELLEELTVKATLEAEEGERMRYFVVDSSLPRWMKLLSNDIESI